MHALVTADTVGGVWTYVRELVTGLSRRGIRVTLVSFGEIPAPRQTKWLDELSDVDYRPTGFHLEWMQDAEQDISLSAEYLTSIVREVNPDILHLNQYCYGSLPVDIPRLVVAHSDVISWSVSVHGDRPAESDWLKWYRETVTKGLSHASAVVAPSQWMLDAIGSYYARPANSAVIHNGRDPNLFNPHITKERYAVAVGRIWDGGKQISLLRETTPPLPVYVAGAHSHPEAVFRNSSAKTRKRNLVFKGLLNEAQLRQLYGRASMYIATSGYEPFGLAPLEAALSRCAIIANDIPSFREIWGDAAYYFERNDSSSLQLAMERLAADSALCSQFANAAYKRAASMFTSARMVDQYLSLYRTLLAAKANAA